MSIEHGRPDGPVADQAKFLRRKDAASYIQSTYGIPCAAQTLAQFAVAGSGPEFQRLGKWAVYTQAACDRWAMSRLTPIVRSTSELAAA